MNRLITTTQLMSGQPNLVSAMGYDGEGNITSQQDPRGVVTTLGYDLLNRNVGITVPLQTGANMITTKAYDSIGNLVTLQKSNTCPNCSGDQVTSYTYDELSRLVTTTLGASGGSDLNYQLANIYDADSNVVEKRQSKGAGSAVTNWTDPAQVITSSTGYDKLNRPITYTVNAWDGTNTNLLNTTYTYDDYTNQVTTLDPSGMSRSQQQDPAGRLISTTVLPNDNSKARETSLSYYDPNNLIIRTLDPLGDQTDLAYDPIHRQNRRTVYTGLNGTGTALTTSTYYQDTPQPLLTTVGPAPYYQRQDMLSDEAGRILSTTVYTGGPVAYPTVPAGALTTLYTNDPQGNVTAVTNPDGYKTLNSYENTGWLTSVVQTATVGGVVKTYTTSYSYDLVGNRLSTTDANIHATQVRYDTLNRQTDEYDALNHNWHTSYDGLSRVTSRTDGKSQQTQYYLRQRLAAVANQ